MKINIKPSFSNRRILIRKQAGLIELVAYGNHDEIRKFLKSFR